MKQDLERILELVSNEARRVGPGDAEEIRLICLKLLDQLHLAETSEIRGTRRRR